MTEANQVIHGDCMDILAKMEDNSIDTIITDPPYHLGSTSKRFTKTSLGDDNDTAANARNGSNQYARLSTGFMGARWDGGGIAFQPELWAEMLRVAKPGAMLLAFGGSRTHHRLMVAIEDAGWEIRDCISHFHAADSREADLLDSMTDDQRQAYLELHYPGKSVHYLYGSGFPKSLSIGKSLDKHAEKEREVVGTAKGVMSPGYEAKDRGDIKPAGQFKPIYNITLPATEAAKTWEGWHSPGLKPAVEPIILAMKPIEKNYANNALVHGVAGLNIDGARIVGAKANGSGQPPLQFNGQNHRPFHDNAKPREFDITQGRWPSNVLLSHSEGCVRRGERKIKGQSGWSKSGSKAGENTSMSGPNYERQPKPDIFTDPNGLETVADWECVEGCPIRILDEQAGVRKSGEPIGNQNATSAFGGGQGVKITGYGDSGSASRFFYTAKAPNREKWFYCQLCAQAYPNKERDNHGHDIPQDQRKHIIAHPTTKPLTIMNYLATLTKTPTGGIVLDPFAGSGTTALACIETGRDFILIEKEADYYEIAKARVEDAMSKPRQAELF